MRSTVLNIYIYIYIYIYKQWALVDLSMCGLNNTYEMMSHRRINVNHGIDVDKHTKPRNNCKYSIL
jgi:hypothetical protein